MATINISNSLLHSTNTYCLSAGTCGSHILMHTDHVCIPTLCTGSTANFNDLVVAGDLTVHGSCTLLNTTVCTTSAMSICNQGTGPALTVTQCGSQPVALFVDQECGNALCIGDNGVATFSKKVNIHDSNATPGVRLSVGRNDNEDIQFCVNDTNNCITAKQDESGTDHAFHLDRRFTTTTCRDDFHISRCGTPQVTVDICGRVGIGTSPSGPFALEIHSDISDSPLRVGSPGVWSGINFCDCQGAENIFFRGLTCTWSFGGGGSSVSGKRIHVDGGATIGANYDGCTTPTNGLLVEGSVVTGSSMRFCGSIIKTGTCGPGRQVCLLSCSTGSTGLEMYDSAGSFKWSMYGTGSDFGFLTAQWGSWGLRYNCSDQRLYLNNNTTYYLAPNSTSYLNHIITAGNTCVDSNIYLRNYGCGVYFNRGSGSDYSNYIKAGCYPSQGYSAGSNYWLEYGTKGGHHFVVNTDSGPGSSENNFDDFTIWQGCVDGDRLFSVSNVGNTCVEGSLCIASASTSGGNLKFTGAANPYICASSYIIMPGGLYVSGGTAYFSNATMHRGGLCRDNATYLQISGGTGCDTYFPGQVGIGTTDPGVKLHIRTATGSDTPGDSNSHIMFDVADDGGPAWGIRLGDTGDDGDFNIDRRNGGSWSNVISLDRTTGKTYIKADAYITSSTNSWDGGLQMLSQDGTDLYCIHPDNNGYMYVNKNWCFNDGDIKFGKSNPYICASSYIYMPGGLYVNGGLLYVAGQTRARGGICNDTATYLDIYGGTCGHTYFSGQVGIGTTDPGSCKLQVQGESKIVGKLHVTSSINLCNTNLCNANHITINDPGVGEGLSWNSTTGGWMIDVSPLNRSNADGNLNLYNSSSNNIALWRPQLWVYDASNYATGTANSDGSLTITSTNTGDTIFSVEGSNGALFSVVDDLSDSLMSVNDAAGLPVLEVFADSSVCAGRYGCSDFYIARW